MSPTAVETPVPLPLPDRLWGAADALAALPGPESEVLWLYHAEGLSFEAIGDRLGVSRKSIRGIWARGLKSLKRSLDGNHRQ